MQGIQEESLLQLFSHLASSRTAASGGSGAGGSGTGAQGSGGGLNGYSSRLLGPLVSPDFDLSLLRDVDYVVPEASLTRRSSASAPWAEDECHYLVDEPAEEYLSGTLALFRSHGINLAPLFTTGDGHCLAHAISRGLLGFEVLFYSLRMRLWHELSVQKEYYLQAMFGDQESVATALEDARPGNHSFGSMLQPVHVLAIANVLRRPVLLLAGEGDDDTDKRGQPGLYLPTRFTPDQCRDPGSGRLPSPLIIAWARRTAQSPINHFVSLVTVLRPPSSSMLPPVWAKELLPYISPVPALHRATELLFSNKHTDETARGLNQLKLLFYSIITASPSADIAGGGAAGSGGIGHQSQPPANLSADGLATVREFEACEDFMGGWVVPRRLLERALSLRGGREVLEAMGFTETKLFGRICSAESLPVWRVDGDLPSACAKSPNLQGLISQLPPPAAAGIKEFISQGAVSGGLASAEVRFQFRNLNESTAEALVLLVQLWEESQMPMLQSGKDAPKEVLRPAVLLEVLRVALSSSDGSLLAMAKTKRLPRVAARFAMQRLAAKEDALRSKRIALEVLGNVLGSAARANVAMDGGAAVGLAEFGLSRGIVGDVVEAVHSFVRTVSQEPPPEHDAADKAQRLYQDMQLKTAHAAAVLASNAFHLLRKLPPAEALGPGLPANWKERLLDLGAMALRMALKATERFADDTRKVVMLALRVVGALLLSEHNIERSCSNPNCACAGRALRGASLGLSPLSSSIAPPALLAHARPLAAVASTTLEPLLAQCVDALASGGVGVEVWEAAYEVCVAFGAPPPEPPSEMSASRQSGESYFALLAKDSAHIKAAYLAVEAMGERYNALITLTPRPPSLQKGASTHRADGPEAGDGELEPPAPATSIEPEVARHLFRRVSFPEAHSKSPVVADLCPRFALEREAVAASTGSPAEKTQRMDQLVEDQMWELASLYANGESGHWLLGAGRDCREIAQLYERDLTGAFQSLTGKPVKQAKTEDEGSIMGAWGLDSKPAPTSAALPPPTVVNHTCPSCGTVVVFHPEDQQALLEQYIYGCLSRQKLAVRCPQCSDLWNFTALVKKFMPSEDEMAFAKQQEAATTVIGPRSNLDVVCEYAEARWKDFIPRAPLPVLQSTPSLPSPSVKPSAKPPAKVITKPSTPRPSRPPSDPVDKGRSKPPTPPTARQPADKRTTGPVAGASGGAEGHHSGKEPAAAVAAAAAPPAAPSAGFQEQMAEVRRRRAAEAHQRQTGQATATTAPPLETGDRVGFMTQAMTSLLDPTLDPSNCEFVLVPGVIDGGKRAFHLGAWISQLSALPPTAGTKMGGQATTSVHGPALLFEMSSEVNKPTVLVFFRDGFTVDRSHLFTYGDPRCATFLTQLCMGFKPRELEGRFYQVIDHRFESQQQVGGFVGQGNRLSSSSSAMPPRASANPAAMGLPAPILDPLGAAPPPPSHLSRQLSASSDYLSEDEGAD